MRAPVFLLQCLAVFAVTLVAHLAFRDWDGFPVAAAPRLPDSPAERRAYLVKHGGGNAESERAVARGLEWLARQQKDDGHWEFDGTSKDKVAATGMALLPFLAAGETHKNKTKHRETVEKGLQWLMKNQRSRAVKGGRSVGAFDTSNMYAHAIATIALCEAAGRTKDPEVKAKAKGALAFVLNAQGANGSWGYTGPEPVEGDTSIVGWQVQALAAAKVAGIEIADEKKVFDKADKFLQSVSTDGGAKYGYREKGASQTLTPVGLLSRHSMGKLEARHPTFGRGVEFLKGFPPQKGYWDTYYYYYATRVVYQAGGDDWHKFWNPRMRDMLVDLQVAEGEAKGSWVKDQGFMGSACGRLGTTAMSLLTLQVYYRDPTPKWLTEPDK